MFDNQLFGSGLGSLFGGLFGNSGSAYDKNQQWLQQAQNAQQPYANAGQGAIGDYQKWLQSQQDPSKFINDQMGNYQESPWAKNLQQQSMNAGQNAASASGLMGSSPLMQQLQQNAGTISSQDQNQWLQNVLGINTQYGQGQQNLMNGGQNAANSMGNIFGQMGENAYNKDASRQNNFWNMMGGAGSMIGSFL